MKTVLVIDDIPEFLQETRKVLKGEFIVKVCSSPVRAIRMARKEPVDLVITTLVMKELDGIQVIRRLRSSSFAAPIILVTRFGDASTGRTATRSGANDYIVRPYPPQELVSRIQRALRDATPGPAKPLNSLEDGIRTEDPRMIALLELAQIAADTDARILILGETGTGKELLAKAIHRRSSRVNRPFIAVNCAAIQENLLESELFGHEKGSFTGAHSQRIGRFEQAGNGTLFLDEIGELPLALQSKLLRVIQSGEFSRVGGNKVLRSQARLVAATNQNLRQQSESGHFRPDLYYRLNVVSLTLPPLRKRLEDIPLLADYFLKRFRSGEASPVRFSDTAISALKGHEWPGNIRELEHVVERCAILVRKPVIDIDDLPPPLNERPLSEPKGFSPQVEPFKIARRRFERSYFERLMDTAGGNFAEGARIAGMERSAFYRKATKALKD